MTVMATQCLNGWMYCIRKMKERAGGKSARAKLDSVLSLVESTIHSLSVDDSILLGNRAAQGDCGVIWCV